MLDLSPAMIREQRLALARYSAAKPPTAAAASDPVTAGTIALTCAGIGPVSAPTPTPVRAFSDAGSSGPTSAASSEGSGKRVNAKLFGTPSADRGEPAATPVLSPGLASAALRLLAAAATADPAQRSRPTKETDSTKEMGARAALTGGGGGGGGGAGKRARKAAPHAGQPAEKRGRGRPRTDPDDPKWHMTHHPAGKAKAAAAAAAAVAADKPKKKPLPRMPANDGGTRHPKPAHVLQRQSHGDGGVSLVRWPGVTLEGAAPPPDAAVGTKLKVRADGGSSAAAGPKRAGKIKIKSPAAVGAAATKKRQSGLVKPKKRSKAQAPPQKSGAKRSFAWSMLDSDSIVRGSKT